ncbi:putative reverse transcriptase domain-containing protein [Tanacetum coccineum]
MTRDCRTPVPATTQRALVAKQKTAVTCYKCGKQGHYKRRTMVFLTRINEEKTKEKSEKKRFEDVRIVRDCLEVFPKDLHGLSPVRQTKFQIDLIPNAASVARSPYRLAPSEMHELSSQLQELSNIRIYMTKFLVLGSSGIIVKKKEESFWMCIKYGELNKSAVVMETYVETKCGQGASEKLVPSCMDTQTYPKVIGKMARWLGDEILRNRIPTLRRDLLGVARFLRWVEAEMVSPEVEGEKWRRLLLD